MTGHRTDAAASAARIPSCRAYYARGTTAARLHGLTSCRHAGAAVLSLFICRIRWRAPGAGRRGVPLRCVRPRPAGHGPGPGDRAGLELDRRAEPRPLPSAVGWGKRWGPKAVALAPGRRARFSSAQRHLVHRRNVQRFTGFHAANDMMVLNGTSLTLRKVSVSGLRGGAVGGAGSSTISLAESRSSGEGDPKLLTISPALQINTKDN